MLAALTSLTLVESSSGAVPGGIARDRVSRAEHRAVAAPRVVRRIATGETGWFSSPGIVDLDADGRREIVAPFYSTFVFDAKGRLRGRGTATNGRVYAPGVVADLNRDGALELVFGTYGAAPRSGRLVVLSGSGRRLHDIRLRDQGTNGNGIGVPAAPSIADLDGDRRLEIVLSTFDHGFDVFRVPR
jgi:hypothetical protein